ncbi:hypothetical protein JL721_11460 [Aureococcus anophagefferens]|nr:hypothetical protein JL721_11460 [Aureococcus anophagefferens]
MRERLRDWTASASEPSRARVMVLNEAGHRGINHPNLGTIVVAQPPSSVPALLQLVGRAARGAGQVGRVVFAFRRGEYFQVAATLRDDRRKLAAFCEVVRLCETVADCWRSVAATILGDEPAPAAAASPSGCCPACDAKLAAAGASAPHVERRAVPEIAQLCDAKASDVVEPFVGAACAPDTATERRGAQKGPGVLLCDGGGVTMACVALRDSVRALAKSCAAGGVHVPGAVVAMRELVHARESAAAAAARDKADALPRGGALPQADAAEFPNFAAVSVAAVPLVVAGRRDDGGSATVLSSRVVAGAGVVYDVQRRRRRGRDAGEVAARARRRERAPPKARRGGSRRHGALARRGALGAVGDGPRDRRGDGRCTKTRELERAATKRDSLAEAEKEESARLALAHERRRAALRDASRARGDAVRTRPGGGPRGDFHTSGALAPERDADALAVRDQAARDRAHDRAALEADVARAREVAVEAERGREREQTKRERAEGCADAERVVSETALAERDALMQRSLSGIVDFSCRAATAAR